MTPGSDSLIDQYSEETLKAIVEEAHARGKKVSGHVHSTRSIERAIRAGFDVLDHCSFKGLQTGFGRRDGRQKNCSQSGCGKGVYSFP